MTTFAPSPALLKSLWLMVAVEDRYLRLSWSPGAGLAPLDLPAPESEEEAVQRLVAEFDAAEVYPRQAPAPQSSMVSYDFAAGDDLESGLQLLGRLCEDRDVLMSAGMRRARGFGTADCAQVLWCRVEGAKQCRELARFRPRPTVVIREGLSTRRVALWSLRRPLEYEWLLRANKRIAHRLWAPKKNAAPEFMFPVPGSCLRVDRARPIPVRVEVFRPDVYTAREVVGRLRDAPDPNAWREAA